MNKEYNKAWRRGWIENNGKLTWLTELVWDPSVAPGPLSRTAMKRKSLIRCRGLLISLNCAKKDSRYTNKEAGYLFIYYFLF